ncbi:MAG: DCC1-like thiol-disulfide oxidoreductase family protein [Myxococcota bacterium]|jgi:predicted DCC family thiol-disulfide oxidoreductase YuxK|nr:DCC1-like thiol-disulfide oxidoreductase family protein [Myxococcota bacterium]MEC9441281.1 DCC1-like thiol-disulfide oxidoreductase family protein [Myxococcota bacterium]
MDEIAKEFALVKRQDLGFMPPLHPGTTDRLLYDGHCGLCHRAVKFVLRHDMSETAFRFTPLQSEQVDAMLPSTTPKETLPDSMVVITSRNEVYTRSDAALYIGKRLGGVWRILATLAEGVPRQVRDTIYDLIAMVRHKLFEKPEEACPIAPPQIRGRFDY